MTTASPVLRNPYAAPSQPTAAALAALSTVAQVQRSFADPVTALISPAVFLDRLDYSLELQTRWPVGVAVLALVLDDLPALQVRYGEAVMSAARTAALQRLHSRIRACDSSTRLTAETILVMLVGVQATRDAEQLASRVLGAVQGPCGVSVHGEPLRAQVGVALSTLCMNARSASGLVCDALGAASEAKQEGHKRVALCAPHEHALNVDGV